jgi:hypothetical protein
MNKKTLLPIFFFFLLVCGVNATTYYVSNSTGSDSNDGLSDSTPWATIDKINDFTFSRGDKILFKGGDEWNKTRLNLHSRDRFSNVYYGSYGIGKAKLQKVYAGNLQNITMENLYFTRAREDVPNGTCLSIDKVKNATFNNIIVDGEFLGAGSGMSIKGQNDTGVFRYSEDIIVKNSEFKNAGAFGSQLASFKIERLVRNVLVENVISHHSYDNNFEISNQDQIFKTGSYNITFRNITGYNSRHAHGMEFGWGTYNCTMENSYFYNNSMSGMTSTLAQNNTYRNNIVDCNLSCFIISESEGVLVENNTFLHNENTVRVIDIRRETNFKNSFYNNIMTMNSIYHPIIFVEDAINDNKLDYNLYYNTGGVRFSINTTTYKGLFNWSNLTGQDNNSLDSNPLLTSNYYPQYNSPACSMSDTGSYVGALPCLSYPNTINPLITGNTSLIVSMVGVIIGIIIISALVYSISVYDISVTFMLSILVSSIIAILTVSIIQSFL